MSYQQTQLDCTQKYELFCLK